MRDDHGSDLFDPPCLLSCIACFAGPRTVYYDVLAVSSPGSCLRFGSRVWWCCPYRLLGWPCGAVCIMMHERTGERTPTLAILLGHEVSAGWCCCYPLQPLFCFPQLGLECLELLAVLCDCLLPVGKMESAYGVGGLSLWGRRGARGADRSTRMVERTSSRHLRFACRVHYRS